MVAQREVHGLGGDVLGARETEQFAQQRLGGGGVIALHHERVAAAAQIDAEPCLDEAQVGVERTAEIGEALVVGGREHELAHDGRRHAAEVGRMVRHALHLRRRARPRRCGRAASALSPR